MLDRSVARSLGIFLVAALGLLSWPCAAAQTTPSGSPNDECCPKERDIHGPYTGKRTKPVDGPTTGGGGSYPSVVYVTADAAGDVAAVVKRIAPPAVIGLEGSAALYGNSTIYPNENDIYLELLEGDYPVPPFPGGTLLSSLGICDPKHKEKFPCAIIPVEYITPWGVEIKDECVCAPVQVGGGGGGSGAAPALFRLPAEQRTALPTKPLVFPSDTTGATAWYHNFWDPATAYFEIKHVDGTVATFGAALLLPDGIQVWRLEEVRDPYDNVADWRYDAQGRLFEIRYPTGIYEQWFYGEDPPGWNPGSYSYVTVSYYDSITQTQLPASHDWGIVFQDLGSLRHFQGRLVRWYFPETKYASLVADAGSGFEYFDLDGQPPVTARPVVNFDYDASGRLRALQTARSTAGLLHYNLPSSGPGSLLDTTVLTYYDTGQAAGKLKASAYPLVARSYDYQYGLAPTRSVPGVTLSRTVRVDASGNTTAYEYDVLTRRIFREEHVPSDDSSGRPRAHEDGQDKSALAAHFREEPTHLRIDYDFGPGCGCSKPTKVAITGFMDDGSSVTRVFEYEYDPVTRLLTKAVLPNPSTDPAAPPTVEVVYTYRTEASPGNGIHWSSWVLWKKTTPDGVYHYDYVWRNRAKLGGHGKMPERITQTLSNVRIQTDFSSTSTANLSWITDLGYVGAYPPGNEPTRLNGQPALVTDGDGVVATLTYDTYGHLRAIAHGGVDTEVVSDSWGTLTQVTLNHGSPSHESVLSIDQGVGGEVYAVHTTVDAAGTAHDLVVESQMAYDEWGNLAVVRRRNRASDGQAPREYGVPPGNAREWVEQQFVYEWSDLVSKYTDRRRLDLPRGGFQGAPFADAPLAWFLVESYDYRADGQLSEIRHANGAVTTVRADGYGTVYTAVTSVGGANPQSFRHRRAFVDPLLQTTAIFEGGTGAGDPKLWTLLERNAAGAVVSLTEPEIDAALLPAGYTGSPGGAFHTFEIDVLGRITRATTTDGATLLREVRRSYDQLGRLIREEQPVVLGGGAAPGGALEEIWSYAAGRESQLAYTKRTGAPDAQGGSAPYQRIFAYESLSGRLTSVTDALGNASILEYHPGTDYLKAVVRHVLDGATSGSVDYRAEYEVDSLGRTVKLRECGDGTLAASGKPQHEFFYNTLGFTDRYVDPLGREQAFLVDALGRVVQHVRVSSGSSDHPTTSAAFTDYFAEGLSIVTRVDGLGRQTITHYDFLGRPFVLRLPGSPAAPSSADKHEPFSYFAEYDLLSRLTHLYDGDEGHTQYWYNGPGYLVQRAVVNASTASQISNFNAKDLLNRDALGRILNAGSFAVDGSGAYTPTVLEAFEVDSLGRTHSEAFLPFGVGNPLEVESVFTNASGFRTGLRYLDHLASGSSPLETQFRADQVGRLDQILWDAAAPGTFSELAEYTYLGSRPRSRVTTVSSGTPAVTIDTSIEYDALGRLSEIEDVVTGQGTVSHFTYDYDLAGNLLKEVYEKHGVPGAGEGDRFTYDEFHRLTVAWLGIDSVGMAAPVDDLLAGTSAAAFVEKLTYGLDAANNRTSVEFDDDDPVTQPVVTNYDVETTSNRYTLIGAAAPVYDDRGNTRFDGQRYYVYDYLNRLSEVYYIAEGSAALTSSGTLTSSQRYAVTNVAVLERARERLLAKFDGSLPRLLRSMQEPGFRGGLRESVRGGVIRIVGGGGGSFLVAPSVEPDLVPLAYYNYDAFNRRTARVIVGIQTYVYAWDGWREAQEATWTFAGAVPRQQYVWGNGLDELLAYREVGGGTYYLTHGGQDTPVRLVDATGTVIEEYEYGPYGRATVFSGSGGQSTNPFRWKGMRVDPETGLGYSRNRYYSFEYGRFWTWDPLGVWADAYNWGNGYAYVGNAPLSRRDPLGLQGNDNSSSTLAFYRHVDGEWYAHGVYPDKKEEDKRAIPLPDGYGDEDAVQREGELLFKAVPLPDKLIQQLWLDSEGPCKIELFKYSKTAEAVANVADRVAAVAGMIAMVSGPIGAVGGLVSLAAGWVGAAANAYNGDCSAIGWEAATAAAGIFGRFAKVARGAPEVAARGGRSLDQLSAAGRVPAPGGFTRAGYVYQKHMGRGELPKVPGKQLDQAGQDLLDDILTNPGTTVHPVTSGNAAGGTRYIGPNGIGATFGPDGSLAYFGRY